MSDVASTAAAPALGFSITANIHGKAQIVVQSFVPLDADPAQINATLDKVMQAVDRQEAKYMLKDLKLVLERDEHMLKNHVDKVAELQNLYQQEYSTSGKRGDFKLVGTQRSNVENLQKTIEGMKINVTRHKANIADLEALAQ